MLFFLLIIFLSLIIFSRLYSNKRSNNKILKFNKSNLYKWMNLTKKERYNMSKDESSSYLIKRKALLDQIRREYKSIPKGDR